MDFTDHSIGELLKSLGLITQDQIVNVFKHKADSCSDLNFYQLSVQLGYIKKGSLDAALEKLGTAPGCVEKFEGR